MDKYQLESSWRTIHRVPVIVDPIKCDSYIERFEECPLDGGEVFPRQQSTPMQLPHLSLSEGPKIERRK